MSDDYQKNLGVALVIGAGDATGGAIARPRQIVFGVWVGQPEDELGPKQPARDHRENPGKKLILDLDGIVIPVAQAGENSQIVDDAEYVFPDAVRQGIPQVGRTDPRLAPSPTGHEGAAAGCLALQYPIDPVTSSGQFSGE